MCWKKNSKKVVVNAKTPSIHENLRDNPGRVERVCYNASESIKSAEGRKSEVGENLIAQEATQVENESDASQTCGPRGWGTDNDRNTSTETQAMHRSELRLEEQLENPEVNDLVQRGEVAPNLPGSSRDGYEGSIKKVSAPNSTGKLGR
jgi:hypothetical protein